MTSPRAGRRTGSVAVVIAISALLALLVSLATPARAAVRSIEDGGRSGGPTSVSGDGGPAGWRLVWRDDFDGPVDASVDRSAWQHALGHCYPGCPAVNWGTGEVPAMTDSTQNVGLDGHGRLLITPRRDPVEPSGWTSGRIETRRADFAAPAGGALRVEARMALPAASGEQAQGFRTGFWMLGARFRPTFTDPDGAGDLDVVEHVNDRPEILGTVHCSPPSGDPCHEVPDNVGLFGTSLCPPGDCRQGMHTYAVELHREARPERIDWFVDDVRYHTVRADNPGMDDATWRLMVDRSFFLVLSQSLGGAWPGPPTAATLSGVPLVVDHVAVFVHRPEAQHPTRSPKHPDHSPKHPEHSDPAERSEPAKHSHPVKRADPEKHSHPVKRADPVKHSEGSPKHPAPARPDRHDEHEPCPRPAADRASGHFV